MEKIIRAILFLTESPLVPFLFLLSILALFQKRVSAWVSSIKSSTQWTLVKSVILILLVCFAFIVLIYFFSNIMLDIISPSIISLSWIFAQGKEVYHVLGADKIYSLLYGPIAYIMNGVFMKIFGPSLFSAKIASVGSLILTFTFAYLSIKPFLKNKRGALLFFGIATGLFLLFFTYSFEARVDAMSLMFVSLGLLVVTKSRGFWPAVICGIALGMSANIKITGVFYFIPVLFILLKKSGGKEVLGSLTISAITGIAPFLIFKNVSLLNYLGWLSAASKNGLDIGSFVNNITYTVFLLVPFLFFLAVSHNQDTQDENVQPPRKTYLALLLLSMLILSVFASKQGSGQNHLLPFVPVILYGYGLFYSAIGTEIVKSGRELAELVFIPFFTTIAIISSITILRIARLDAIYPVKARYDIAQIMNKYSGYSINMGYSESSGDRNLTTNLPSFRPLLTFTGNDVILDKMALGDYEESGALLPNTLVNRFQDCQKQVWLFPRGSKPFEGELGYGKPLFTDEFYKVFFNNFRFRESIGYYDIWSCVK